MTDPRYSRCLLQQRVDLPFSVVALINSYLFLKYLGIVTKLTK